LDRRLPTLAVWSTGLGISLGAFMIIREESIWILPAFLVLLTACLLIIWLKKLDRKIPRTLLVVLSALILYIPVFVVSFLNYSHYGFWGISENLDPDFKRVLNTLGRIKTDTPWHPAIQITKAARMKAYQASPLFNSLKDDIESAVPGWNVHDDNAMTSKPVWYLQKYGNGGSELGVHFMWLFRDAVAAKGYYSNGKYPSEFYKNLADQLEAACREGKLECTSLRNIPTVGSIDRRSYPIIWHLLGDDFWGLLNLDYMPINSLAINNWPAWPEGSSDDQYFNELIYNPVDLSECTNKPVLVNGRTELRVKMLSIKEKIMTGIYDIYKLFTRFIFIFALMIWIFQVIRGIRKKEGFVFIQFLLILCYILGLLFSRMMTLTIVDATTSMRGIPLYGMSNYLFIGLFPLIVVFWELGRSRYLPQLRRKVV